MINWKKDFFVTPAKVIAVFVVLAAVLTISLSFGKAIFLAVWNLLSHPELINVPDLNTFAIAVFGGIGFSFYLTAFGAIVEESNALAGSLRSNSEKPSISPKVYLFGLWSICFITLAVSLLSLLSSNLKSLMLLMLTYLVMSIRELLHVTQSRGLH